jgi:rhamnogalacturonyl hydrolase YesR
MHTRSIIYLVVIFFSSQTLLYAQNDAKYVSAGKYMQELKSLQHAIEKSFYDSAAGFYKEHAVAKKDDNPYSYLWPLCGLIQAENEIEKVDKQRGGFDRILNIIKYYYDTAAPAPGYASYIMKFKGGDRFYDDNQWIGIASMDAYSRFKKDAYLKVGEEIYRYMMSGYDTVLSGGIYWQENKKVSKNTCSNGPGIILALQLYEATKNKTYLDTALLIYNWVNKNLQAPSGLYHDNISISDKKIGKAIYSYNTGTMLQSNVYLYEITKDEQYLRKAISIADSSLEYFYKGGIFRDNNYWFNAVLLRAYQHLLHYKKNEKYLRAFKACTDRALGTNKNLSGLMGKDSPLNLVEQSGMLEILARLAYLEKNGQL